MEGERRIGRAVFLTSVAGGLSSLLWGKPATIHTMKGREADEPLWFTGQPDGRSEQHTKAPT